VLKYAPEGRFVKPNELSEILNALSNAKWASFFLALAGGVVSMITAALVSYLKEKGKHWATEENFKSMLKQSEETRRAQQKADLTSLAENIETRLGIVRSEITASKEAEFQVIREHLSTIAAQETAKKSGELDGVHQNLQKLVDQVEAVTAKTEEIKQRVGNEIWMQQTLRNEKRTIYAELCKLIGGLIHNHEQMMRVAQKIRGDSPEILDMLSELADKMEHREAETPDEVQPFMDEHLRLTRSLHESRTQLRIYCRPAALRAFEEFVAAKLGTTNRYEIGKSLEDLKILERRIASVASFDLGLPVQGFSRDEDDPQKRNRAEVTCPECFKIGVVAKPKLGIIKCPQCSLQFGVSA
jgi:hypothetical protein